MRSLLGSIFAVSYFYKAFLFVYVFLLLRGVVEYDAEGFTKLTLLLMWKDFCFLVHSEYTFALSISIYIFKCCKCHVIINMRIFRV